MDAIIKEVKTAKYYSISVDSTPDIAHIDQLTTIVRYVLPTGPVEHFLTFVPMFGHSGYYYITDILLSFLDKKGINIKDCRGQSYDNAANMSEKYVGMQALIRKKWKYADYVPCTAHSLNLVGTNASESCLAAVNFFYIVQGVYFFCSFHLSLAEIV